MKRILRTKRKFNLVKEHDCFYIEKNDRQFSMRYKDVREILRLWKETVEEQFED